MTIIACFIMLVAVIMLAVALLHGKPEYRDYDDRDWRDM